LTFVEKTIVFKIFNYIHFSFYHFFTSASSNFPSRALEFCLLVMNDAAFGRVFVFATDNLQDMNISTRHEVTLMVLCKTKGLFCCVCHGERTLWEAIVIASDTECSLICAPVFLFFLQKDTTQAREIKSKPELDIIQRTFWGHRQMPII